MFLNSLKSIAKQSLFNLKINLSEIQIDLLRHSFFRMQHIFGSVLHSNNLQKLAALYDAGKHAWYPQLYMKHFSDIRHKKLNILEIGVGGYSEPKSGGGSLRMWRTYFPNSRIFGIDIYDKKFHEEPRIKIFQGSQSDKNFLENVVHEIGNIDIIIDDGSHVNEHVILSFKTLFPLLNTNGIYVIEDTQTSYWPEFGGLSTELNSECTTMGFFKKLVDGLNYEEFLCEAHVPSYFDKHIKAIHFYHNLVIIEKGGNDDGSHILSKRF